MPLGRGWGTTLRSRAASKPLRRRPNAQAKWLSQPDAELTWTGSSPGSYAAGGNHLLLDLTSTIG